MKLTITIDLDGDAFEDDPHAEVSRILTAYTDRLLSVGMNHARPGESQELFSLLDSTGTTVGAFTVSA